MNTPGVIEWQDELSLQAYPLDASLGINDLLVGASFVQFDGFTPTLKSYQVVDDNLTVTLTLDDGTWSFSRALSDVLTDRRISLTKDGRYHGVLTFGRGLELVVSGQGGKTINVNKRFSPLTVTSLNSRDGLYSLQKASGALTISTDIHQSFEVEGQTVTWHSVGLPAKTVQYQLTHGELTGYGLVAKRKIVKIGLSAGEVTELCDVGEGQPVNHLLVRSYGDCYMVGGKVLYSANSLPPKVLKSDFNDELVSCVDYDIDHILVIGAYIHKVNVTNNTVVGDPLTVGVGFTPEMAPTVIHSSFVGIAKVHGATSEYYMTTLGPNQNAWLYHFNFDTNVYKLLGELHWAADGFQSNRTGGVVALFDSPQGLFTVLKDTDGTTIDHDDVNAKYRICSVNPVVCTVTPLGYTYYRDDFGDVLSLSYGYNAVINSSAFNPLLRINTKTPENNTITLEDTSLIKFRPNAGGLMVELGVGGETLKLNRTKKYA